MVTEVSFEINSGEVLAVVGESGSGKSVTALALMRLHPKNTDITGTVNFDGIDVLSLTEEQMRSIRGRERRDDLPGSDDRDEPGVHGG